ncbi:MAG: YaiI/YqxD family protein [Planctomycetota bacterium]|jgi:uncharacterized protein YaiI (UPF0178 family)
MTQAPSQPTITVYVDADACPVKREIYKVAKRYGLKVLVVANQYMEVPQRDYIELITVGRHADAADDWIAERAGPDDIVVTQDIPLADRAVKSGSQVLTPRGRTLDEDTICNALATRNLLEELRSAGTITGGPKGFEPSDRSCFLGKLDETVHFVKRLQRRRPPADPPNTE